MSFKYTTNDRPDYIDDLEEAAHLFETGKSGSFFCMEDDVWEIARHSEELPHFSNIYSSIILSRLESALTEEFKALDLEIDTYINSIDTHFMINGDEVKSLEDIGDVVVEAYNEKKEHIDSSALDEIKEKMQYFFDYEDEEEQEQVQEENLDQVQSKAHDELATNSNNTRRNK